MTQEALKLALVALEEAWIFAVSTFQPTEKAIDLYDEARAAIKEALAQEQEPVKMVAYNCFCGRTMKFESVHGVVAPQRTWVGLTDEDEIDWEEGGNLKDLVKAIEAKLKELNT